MSHTPPNLITMNAILLGVSDLFDAQILKNEVLSGSLKSAVLLTPKLETLVECRALYERWYSEKNGVLLDLTLYQDALYIRTISKPISQATGKKDVIDADTIKKLTSGFRAFMLTMVREWKKANEDLTKQKNSNWAVQMVAAAYDFKSQGYELDDSQSAFRGSVLDKTVVAMTPKGDTRAVRRATWEVRPTNSAEIVDLDVTLSLKGLSKAQLQKVIDTLTKLEV